MEVQDHQAAMVAKRFFAMPQSPPSPYHRDLKSVRTTEEFSSVPIEGPAGGVVLYCRENSLKEYLTRVWRTPAEKVNVLL